MPHKKYTYDQLQKMLILKFSECDSQICRHKIAINGFKCKKNQSMNQ